VFRPKLSERMPFQKFFVCSASQCKIALGVGGGGKLIPNGLFVCTCMRLRTDLCILLSTFGWLFIVVSFAQKKHLKISTIIVHMPDK